VVFIQQCLEEERDKRGGGLRQKRRRRLNDIYLEYNMDDDEIHVRCFLKCYTLG